MSDPSKDTQPSGQPNAQPKPDQPKPEAQPRADPLREPQQPRHDPLRIDRDPYRSGQRDLDPLGVGAHPNPYGNPNPFGVGHSDLYPGGFAPPGFPGYHPDAGGGNLVGPNHPMFGGARRGGEPPLGFPGPPPGARFDPYGPPGAGVPPNPRPDHLKPPNYGDDMFM